MDMKGRHLIIAFFCFFLFVARPSYSQKTDTLVTGQQLGGGDHLVSNFEICKLGFFQAQNRYYLGIWYNQTNEKPVWVANPDTPIFDKFATLKLDTDGWLKISHNGSNTTITLNSIRAAGKASATLQNDCNFVLNELNSDGSTKQVLWQSFDHPTDTLLPGMKLGFDLNSGKTWSLRSWLVDDIPGTGSFTLGMNANDSSSQLIIWWRENVFWTSGPWHDGSFTNTDSLSVLYNFSFVSNDTHKYFTYIVSKDTVFSKLTITALGGLKGAYNGTNEYENILVSCDDTFSDNGCVKQKLPICRNTNGWNAKSDYRPSSDGFKLGKSENMTLMDCKVECLNNCSCVAYASSNDNGTGCEFWSSFSEFVYSPYSDYSRLIYEIVIPKDPVKKNLLNWGKRVCIIEGIAQGLIYLHKYSRLRIIHRDLKASNILLDNEMNPKISDFGLARIFELHESEAKTNRIVGTYGYMSPEYAMQGIVSMKIDVFSFGVLLLEIVSGKKNNSFYHYERPLTLVGYAWELWKEDRAMELVDPTLIETCPTNEVLRCVHVGLLCVQDHAEDRPAMTDVVAMLSNETMQLCAPRQPAFLIKVDGHIAEIKCDNFSLCQVSISEMEAR